MALLGNGFEDPQSAAIMALAGGLLQKNFGGGLLAANNAYAEHKANALKSQYAQMQMEEKRMAMGKAKRDEANEMQIRQAARESYNTPQFANAASMGPMPDGSAMPTVKPGFDQASFLDRVSAIDPLKAQHYAQGWAKDNTPLNVAAGGSLVGRDGKVLFTAPTKDPELPSSVREYEYAKKMQNYPGTYEQWTTAQRRAGASNVNVNTKQEGAESKEVGEFFGKNYAEVQKAGFNASGTINRVDRLDQLLSSVDTGKFAPLGLEVAKAAQSFGLNIDPKLGNKEAAVALSSEMALQLRNPSGGAGMPGAMSDADRQFLAGMVPGIEKTPEGRKTIMDTARKMAKRDQDVARLARDYRKKNGNIDEGFYDQLAQFSEANRLFSGPASPAPSKLTPAEAQELAALKARFK